MRKLTKKLVAMTLATATIASSIAVAPAQSASAAKSYKTYLMYADSKWACVNMDADDLPAAQKKMLAKTTVKNKKGTKTYTVTLKRAKAWKQPGYGKAAAAKECSVFCVDIKDILKDYSVKKLKISNVTVTLDGKKVKAKNYDQGQLEVKSDPDKYRLELYNVYGDGSTSDHPDLAKKYKWKKSISVSFSLKIKK